MKIVYIFLFFSLFLSINSFSQDTKLSKSTAETIDEVSIPTEVKAKLNNFFNALSNNEIDNALDNLLLNSPLKERKDDLSVLKEQTERAIRIYGKFSGAKFVNGHFASEVYLRLRYIGLYEKYPMRWIFTYYKSPKLGWIVTNIKLDDLTEFYLGE